MLWWQLSRSKEAFSVAFCILFSLGCLVFNSNIIVRGIGSFQKVGNVVSGSIDSFGGFFTGAFDKLKSYESLEKERDACVAVLEDYKQLPQDLQRTKHENEALRKELAFQSRTTFETLKAEVLSVRLNSIYRTIIIGKGSDSGIQPYMPVTSRALDQKGNLIEAVVGKVIAVSSDSAVVQPLINSNFKMGVSMPESNLWADLSGNSGRATEALLNYIDSGIVIDPRIFGEYPMGPGELMQYAGSLSKIGRPVFSSGASGLFPSGIPVGVIIEEGPRNGSFKTAYLKPFVQFETLEYVNIIKKLPEKWAETWPEGQTIEIDNPYFGELDIPENKAPVRRKSPAPAATQEDVESLPSEGEAQ